MIKIHNFYIVLHEIGPYDFLNRETLILKKHSVLFILKKVESTSYSNITCLLHNKTIEIVESWFNNNMMLL